MRKASIDFGFKRSGIAISDPNGKIITTVKTVKPSKIVEELKNIESLCEVIFGLPLNLKMRFTRSTTAAVDKAIEVAKLIAPIPVYMVDERFTSTIANAQIRSSNSKKSLVDGLSASIIFQDYMRGIKRHRVSWKLPKISDEIVNLISGCGPFEKIYLVGGGMRGLELKNVAPKYEIFEDDPVCFRLRGLNISETKSNISLHFGVFWDIILYELSDNSICSTLLICDDIHIRDDEIKKLPFELTTIVETKEGPVKVGGRSMKILKVKQL